MKTSYLIVIFLSLTSILSSAYAAQLVCPTDSLKNHVSTLLGKHGIQKDEWVFSTNKFNFSNFTYTPELKLYANTLANAKDLAITIFKHAKFNKTDSIARKACVYTYTGHNVIVKYKK